MIMNQPIQRRALSEKRELKHRIYLNVYSLFGAPIWSSAIDTFGSKQHAEQTAKEYKSGLRGDYGFLCWINSRIETTEWEAA